MSATTPTPHATLAAALAAFQGEVKDPHRGRTANVVAKSGAKYSYTYADLGDLLRAVRPTLSRHGLAVSQVVRADGPHPVLLSTLLHAASDQRLESAYPLHWPSGAQERGSELTYARRYSLEALLGVAPSEEDDDGAAAQEEERREQERREAERRQGRTTSAPAKAAPTPPADPAPPAAPPRLHHPTWERGKGSLFGALSRWSEEDGAPITYDHVAAYLQSLGKPRPSEMDPGERANLQRWLGERASRDLVRARVTVTEVARG